MSKKLGEALRDLRLEKNLTQEQLADKLGLTRQSVSSWERGRSLPDIEMINTIADLFGVSVNALFLTEIKSANDKLRYFRMLTWVFVVIFISILTIVIYNSLYPSYKTNIEEYKGECVSSRNEYEISVSENFPYSHNLVNTYHITKDVEVYYEFGIYCVPVEFEFLDPSKELPISSLSDVKIKVPYGFTIDNYRASVSYILNKEQWWLSYGMQLSVLEKKSSEDIIHSWYLGKGVGFSLEDDQIYETRG